MSPSPMAATGSCSSSKRMCRWTGCSKVDPFETVQELADHVNLVHVDIFKSQDLVICLWEGCKAYNVPCQKKLWLAQHMRRHTNERPYKCIMNGCNQSFWNVDALSHHLQLHLLPSPQSSSKKSKKQIDTNSPIINVIPSRRSCGTPPAGSSHGTAVEFESAESSLKHLEVSIPDTTKFHHSSIVCPPQPIAVNGKDYG